MEEANCINKFKKCSWILRFTKRLVALDMEYYEGRIINFTLTLLRLKLELIFKCLHLYL